MYQADKITGYLDTAAEWSGGYADLKSVYDFLKNLKKFNPANLPLISVGTISYARSSNFKQISDIYKKARNNYT